MLTTHVGWFLSLLVLTVAACGSSSNAGTGSGGAGASGGQAGGGSAGSASGGQAGSGSAGSGAGGQAGGGSGGGGSGGQPGSGGGGQARGGSGGQARGGSGGQAGSGGTGGTGGGATFPCPRQGSGTLRCQRGLQYCRLTSLGSSNCVALPAACGATPSCSCIPLNFPACDSCTQSASGDIEVLFAADCFTPDGSPQ
jgi:hypothetical protein